MDKNQSFIGKQRLEQLKLTIEQQVEKIKPEFEKLDSVGQELTKTDN